MKILKNISLPLIACVVAASTSAVTMVADFDGSYGNYSTPANFQSDYDIAGEADFEITSHYEFWNTGYADLVGNIYNDIGTALLIEIRALSGFQVTLDSFQIAPYASRDDLTGYSVADLSDTGTSLISASSLDLNDSTALTVSPNLTSTSGFLISFGPDAWNNGMDNITFTTSAVVNTGSGNNPVPDTGSTMALLGLGLAGIGYAARKKNS